MTYNVLIGMESSGTVRDAFRALGVAAISCDLLPTQADGPHMQCDIFEAVQSQRWDLIIAHPTCTKLCVSGNHVYAAGKPRHQERLDAVAWTEQLWQACKAQAAAVCFENPVGVLSTMSNLPKPAYVQPYDFGEDASKKTALFLHNLQPLKPTRRQPGRQVTYKGKQFERWANQCNSGQNRLGPSADRWQVRSKTYKGIAEAMAHQWGWLLS